MKRFLILLFIIPAAGLFFTACENKPRVDLDSILINTPVQRFDRAFFAIDSLNVAASLPQLEKEFAPFFSNGAELIFWENQRRDPLQLALFAKTEKLFGDMERESAQLNATLKRYYHYFGLKDTLQLYTYISRLDYEFPIVYAPPYIFVALDLYLGEAGEAYYQVLPQYLQYPRQAAFLNRDLAFALAEYHIPPPMEPHSLLDAMLYRGKVLKLTEYLLETVEESTLLRYPPEKYNFSLKHEKEMWVYFIENELLFDTGDELKRRFMETAPFSKFRTQIDRETPGQIGWWFGYKVVSAWLEEYPDMPLEDWIHEMDSRKVLKLSQYKP